MKRSNVRLSVCLSRQSTAAAAAGGITAERPADRRYRSTVGAGTQQQQRPLWRPHAARRSAANAGSVTLTADVGG